MMSAGKSIGGTMLLICFGLVSHVRRRKMAGGLDSCGHAGVVWNWTGLAAGAELTGGATIDVCR